MADPGPMRPVDRVCPKRRIATRSDRCISCNGEAITFRDTLSRREYIISAMCQICQDEVFDVPLPSYPERWDDSDDIPF